MTLVGVSIINFQASKQTIRCVDSLLAGQDHGLGEVSLAIRVADNHSDPDDFRRLEEGLAGKGKVLLQRNERNLGFAAGHNRNIDHLISEDEPDFVWLLNNDVEVMPGTLEALLRCATARPEVGIWGATLLDAEDGPIQCAGGCRYRPWLSSFRACGAGEKKARLHELPEPRLDYVAGASLFMPLDTLKSGLRAPRSRRRDTGEWWLNEEFFLYFEELDLARRLRPGVAMAWCRDALIVHAGGAGTGSTAGRRSYQGEFHSTLSALKYTDLYLPGMLWVTAPSRLLVKTLVNLFSLRFDLLGALYSAYAEFFAWRRAEA